MFLFYLHVDLLKYQISIEIQENHMMEKDDN